MQSKRAEPLPNDSAPRRIRLNQLVLISRLLVTNRGGKDGSTSFPPPESPSPPTKKIFHRLRDVFAIPDTLDCSHTSEDAVRESVNPPGSSLCVANACHILEGIVAVQKILRITIISIAFVVLMLAANLCAQQSLAQAAVHPHKTSAHQGASAEPLLTGDNGTQTGVAKFQGNFTAITGPSGQVLTLTREPDCSLTLLTGSYSFGPPLSYTPSALFTDYERVLHTDAGLSTPVDAFPSGCAAPTTGLSTRPTTFVGKTTNGISVFIYVGYNFTFNTNALYILTGNATFTLNQFAFSNAGEVTTADLNNDGNTDLIIVSNGALSTTGQIYVMLGNPDGTFQNAVSYPTSGTTSIAAVVDDFNGDKKLDIVTSSDNGMISVLTGNGDGTFNTAQSFAAPTPSYPGSALTPSTSLTNLISADLRGVGKKDIIASNGLVLLGNGNGTFTPASSAAFPPLTAVTNYGPNLATGDLNKDGKLDLAVANGADVFTYLGKGDGTFTPSLNYSTVSTDGFVAISDLDGDGNPDIYIGDANAGSFRGDGDDLNVAYALMGNGDGTFSGAPATTGRYLGNNLGDVNGDGMPDLITNNIGQSFLVELGTSKGTFNPVSTITLPPSITVSVSELLSPVTINTASLSITSYAVGDLNGDGKADLAFVCNNGNYAVYFIALSNGDGTFATPIAYGFPQIAPSNGFDITTTISNLQIGDFNHDGKADLLFSFNDIAGPFGNGLYLQGIGVLPGVGNGTFGAPTFTYSYNSTTTPPTDPIVGLPSVAAIADLNKDGNPDLIAVTASGGPSTSFGTILQVYLGKGDGTFAAPTTVSTAANPGLICTSCSLVLADFNNDNNLDLAVVGETNAGQGQIAVSLGNGSGTFAAPTILNVSGGDAVRSAGIAAADFDGDRNIDIAFLNSEGVSGVYYGIGNGTFTSVTSNGTSYPKDLINLAADGGAIALDLNKDGKPDVLVGSTLLLNLQNAPTIVTQTNTATAIAASATTIAQNSSITFTATVTPAAGSATPTGSVTFADGQTIFGSATVDGTGKATFTTSALASGTRSITAAYGGSTTFLGSLSSISTVNVTPAAAGVGTTTNLVASATSAIAGTSLTFTATVTPVSGSTAPTGTVTFADSGTTIGTGTLDGTGKTTFATSTLAVGNHSITASYGGATTPVAFSNSASSPVAITITAAPIISTTTTVSTSAVNGTAVVGTSITLTATVTPASGSTTPSGTVTFADNGTTIGTGTLASGKATFATSTLAVGSHSITAAYGGAATFSSSTSGAQPLTITAAPASDFSIALSPATATVVHGNTTTSTITVTPIGGFKQAVQLTITGTPTNTTVTTAATSVTSTDGVAPATTTLTLQAYVQIAAQSRRLHTIEFAAILPLGLFCSLSLFGLRRRRWPLQLILLAAATALLAATGCGGHSSSASTTNNPTPGTYTLTVTGTSIVGTGTLTHTATYVVTIQ
jgi:Bacterial Ig-like domain (group 3)/FG-GAP-like repeat